MVALVAFGIYRWMNRPAQIPHVVQAVRLTNDGWRKFALLSDGVRLYFSERGSIFQSSATGGETTELPTGLHDLRYLPRWVGVTHSEWRAGVGNGRAFLLDRGAPSRNST
jgi:hypothetical protein